MTRSESCNDFLARRDARRARYVAVTLGRPEGGISNYGQRFQLLKPVQKTFRPPCSQSSTARLCGVKFKRRRDYRNDVIYPQYVYPQYNVEYTANKYVKRWNGTRVQQSFFV